MVKNKMKSNYITVITGVTGQDGSYLAELLLKFGYTVVGITRRKSVNSGLENLTNVINDPRFTLIEGDILDPSFIVNVVTKYKPADWYNLAAQSNVGHSFKEPSLTFEVNANAVLIQLEAIRMFSPSTRYYQASTSELWGGLQCPKTGYNESMGFHPRSPYGVSKLASYWTVVNYREAYGLFACNGILHNHSSPRRGIDFATRKITHGVAKVKLGLADHVAMGDLSAFRDEGHSKDYVEAMWLMLTAEQPADYVISTGRGASIFQMFDFVCNLAGLRFEDVYRVDQRFMRPSEVPYLLGDSTLAKRELKWRPTYSWETLLEEMYLNDLKLLTSNNL
jgi:GDPmannose 4,6-dehydratase